jgi:hypothetical protein
MAAASTPNGKNTVRAAETVATTDLSAKFNMTK